MADDDLLSAREAGFEEPLSATVLKLPEVRAVAEGLVEAGIDAFVDNDAVDAIPIVATVKALVRGAVGYREAWLAKKLVAMLFAVGDVTPEDVERWSKRLQDEAGQRDVGERVLAVVDRVTSVWKAELVGRAFRAYLDGAFERREFLLLAEMLDAALTEDLRYFLEEWSDGLDSASCQRLIAVGLMRDRASRLLLESSQSPSPTDAGVLLRQAATRRT